jgi:dTDP-4-dehydrorhamnose reductase
VDTILVVGVDTVVGANLALECSANNRVVGIDHTGSVSLSECEILSGNSARHENAARTIADCDATHVVFCGPAGESSWDAATAKKLTRAAIEQARSWANAAVENNARFTCFSSDAVFTGPWMFHDEECPGQCESAQAAIVRDAESAVLEECPAALIVRTNAFGWSPLGEAGWIERQLISIARDRVLSLDSIRHGTPILATDLAKIVMRAWEDELSGVFHIAGAERVNPAKFFQRLADRFELPWLSIRESMVLEGRPQGFGEGECSLQTKKIRKALCLAMPIISESLDGLLQQYENGHCERLGHQGALLNDASGAAA